MCSDIDTVRKNSLQTLYILSDERAWFRAAKEYKLADEHRQLLNSFGVTVSDLSRERSEYTWLGYRWCTKTSLLKNDIHEASVCSP